MEMETKMETETEMEMEMETKMETERMVNLLLSWNFLLNVPVDFEKLESISRQSWAIGNLGTRQINILKNILES
jgi:hypothetical protein